MFMSAIIAFFIGLLWPYPRQNSHKSLGSDFGLSGKICSHFRGYFELFFLSWLHPTAYFRQPSASILWPQWGPSSAPRWNFQPASFYPVWPLDRTSRFIMLPVTYFHCVAERTMIRQAFIERLHRVQINHRSSSLLNSCLNGRLSTRGLHWFILRLSDNRSLIARTLKCLGEFGPICI